MENPSDTFLYLSPVDVGRVGLNPSINGVSAAGPREFRGNKPNSFKRSSRRIQLRKEQKRLSYYAFELFNERLEQVERELRKFRSKKEKIDRLLADPGINPKPDFTVKSLTRSLIHYKPVIDKKKKTVTFDKFKYVKLIY